MGYKNNDLKKGAKFALFVSSYLPLFILVILRQLSDNYNYLHWGGISINSIKIFLSFFGLSSVLTLVSILGIIGLYNTLKNIEDISENGFNAQIIDIKNKNSESIGYIATYIIPFLFQSLNGWYEGISILFLMGIIYKIYINSSMILINPILSCKYSIYDIEYSKNKKIKNGFIISKDNSLQDEDKIKLYEIGSKLFFAINKE